MIWRFACTAPQVHKISEHGASRSKVNTVMNACTEAKAVGLALKLDYFLVSTRECYSASTVLGTIKNYINLNLDTIWLTHSNTFSLLPWDIQWICGKCNVNEIWDSEPCCISCLSAEPEEGPKNIGRLVLDFMKWMDFDGENDPEMVTWEVCRRHGVKELLLVVGDEGLELERDVSFVSPTLEPWLTYLNMTQELKIPLNDGLDLLYNAASRTWQDLEELMVEKAEIFKLERAKEREEAFACKQINFRQVSRLTFLQREWSQKKKLITPHGANGLP